MTPFLRVAPWKTPSSLGTTNQVFAPRSSSLNPIWLLRWLIPWSSTKKVVMRKVANFVSSHAPATPVAA